MTLARGGGKTLLFDAVASLSGGTNT